MNSDDKDKLNECLEILDSTELVHSMVWLWTWSTVDYILKNEMYKANVTLDEMWTHLSEIALDHKVFSLEYGAEQHQEDLVDWMLGNNFIESAI